MNIEELDKYIKVNTTVNLDNLVEIDPLKNENIKILGLPFCKTNNNYTRNLNEFKDEIRGVNPNLLYLGNCSTGGVLSFTTNSKNLAIYIKLDKTPNMNHMTNIGEAGVDLYRKYDERYRFVNIARVGNNDIEYVASLIANSDSKSKDLLINLPLYSQVVDMKIFIDKDASISLNNDFSNKKWVFYGTSITQGGCASRPGMSYINILSRHYKKDIVNLGYSGNGLGEEVIAKMITKIDELDTVFIDYDANSISGGTLYNSLEKFISIIKEFNKDIKVVVISRVKTIVRFNDDYQRNLFIKTKKFEQDVVEKLNNKYTNVYFIDGDNLFDDDFDEYTVDTIHFTDLGYYIFSKNLIKEIDKI